MSEHTKGAVIMNPVYSEFKRKFSVSLFKNRGISLGEMSFFKDFVNDLRGDPYPLMEKGEGCMERIGENRYHLSGGFAKRMFCQLFPFATYEIRAEKVSYLQQRRHEGGAFPFS